jgi:hypothetical protein
MVITLRPVRVATGHEEEGNLVFDDHGRLVAVLVRLSDQNEVAPGHWFLEVGFDGLDVASPPIFVDLTVAQRWIRERLARAARVASAGLS